MLLLQLIRNALRPTPDLRHDLSLRQPWSGPVDREDRKANENLRNFICIVWSMIILQINVYGLRVAFGGPREEI
jgi:hypothetical protein